MSGEFTIPELTAQIDELRGLLEERWAQTAESLFEAAKAIAAAGSAVIELSRRIEDVSQLIDTHRNDEHNAEHDARMSWP